MKIDLHEEKQEKRKKRIFIPLIYFGLEILLYWLILSLFEINFKLYEWHLLSKMIFILFILYAFSKMIHIYKRQKNLKKA